MLQSQSFQSITRGFPSERIFSEELVGQSASVLQTVSSWLAPLPACDAPEYAPPPPQWLFGTSLETCNDPNIFLALRVFGGPQQLAVFSFSEDGELDDIEAADDEFVIDAHEAFQLWFASEGSQLTRRELLP